MAKQFSGEVSLTRARMIYKALGFQTAGNWSAASLQKKLEKLDTLIEGADLDKKNLKKVNEILSAQAKGRKVLVVDIDDVAADKKREQDVDDAKKRESQRRVEKKEKTATKEKASVKKKVEGERTAKKAKAAVAAKQKDKKPGIIMSVLEFVENDSPISEKKILSLLKKRFPDKNPESMERTISRVPNYLSREKGIKKLGINDKGQFVINKK